MYKYLLFLTACTTLLFSCKKDDSVSPDGNDNKLIGTWAFINMTAHTSATSTEVIDGDTYKYVTISDYTTINNAGELVIDATTQATKDFSYSIDTDAYATSYVNDVLQETISSPYSFTAVASSGRAPYKLIGTDSLYLSVGTVTTGTTTVPSTAAGVKFSWSGDTLLVKSTAFVPASAGYVGYSTQIMRYIRK